ncbi:SDR family oxidoreductase [Paramicrobacterium sp. CJ85]|uniref:SDR family oxidoreductase n=1 Tax=Paramicrobacterium sp. CJ85 TaxID=3445355 RepID=UPI003F5EA81E
MSNLTILVTGATGTVGAALVPALRDSGAQVRAMTRNPDYTLTGAQTVVADLHDPDSITTALNGVDAVFLNSPSTEDAAELQIRFLDLAAQAGIARAVVLSQYGATRSSPVRFLRWHAQVEEHIRRLNISATVLRPNLYLQSLLAFADTIAQGTLAAPIGTAAVSAIDTRDIADAAAAVLTSNDHDKETYTLTGPRAITHSEIADALNAATGNTIAFQDLPPEHFTAALENYVPQWQLEGLVEDYAHYSRGEASSVTTTIADLTGRPARDVDDFARDYAAAFTRQ